MDNTLCIYVNLVFIVITLIMLPGAVKIDRRQKKFLLLPFYLSILCWQIIDTLIFVVHDAFWIRNLYDLAFMPMGIAIVLFFLLIMRFFRVEKFLTKKTTALLFIVPVISSVLAFTTVHHSLYRISFEVVATDPLLLVENVRGIWYYIQFAFYSVLNVSAFIIAIRYYRKLPPAYRRGPFWLIVLVVICILGAILSFLNTALPELDLFLFCLCAGSVIFYMVNIMTERLDYFSFERKEVFNYLAEAIFILDTKGTIMDANTRAKRALNNFGVQGKNLNLDAIMQELAHAGRIILKHAPDGVGTDIYVPTHAYHDAYNLRSYEINGRDGKTVGSIVIISDVTKNRLTIERYNELAGVDPLTGLFNRYYYQNLLGELDTPENLPLSVIIGDLNGLKHANDTKGHDYGDMLLKGVAATLAECCPPDGYTARIGGDEFIMLLPRRNADFAQRLIDEIRGAIAQKPLLSESSVALGCATKTTPELNINRLFDNADSNMYKNKG